MNIAYLVQQFPPEVGAGPARVSEFAHRWQAQGAHITVLTALPSRMVPGQRAGAQDPRYRGMFMRETWNEIEVLRSWCYASARRGFLGTIGNNASFMITAAAHGLVRLRRPDVLIASSPPFFPHIAGRFLATVKRTPLVLELRDLWPDYLVGMGIIRADSTAAKALFRLEHALLQSAAAIVVVTESFARILESRGIDPARIILVPNGVDLEQYHRIEGPPMAEYRRGEFTIGYLGNFGAGQDLSGIVRAAKLLEPDGVHVTLVGDGPDRERVEQTVRSLGVRNVSIHDTIAKDLTVACYQSFDVCLVPLAPIQALQDAMPSKIFEIMACERPVLVSADGEARRLVEAARCGLAVPPGDAPAIADAVRRLRALTTDERRHLGDRGRAYVRQHYSRDLLAKLYHERLQAVVDARTNGNVRAHRSEIAAD